MGMFNAKMYFKGMICEVVDFMCLAEDADKYGLL
jgi:hypothetical protein